MAKAILEFDLNDPDDIMAHMRAVKSTDMALVLWEIVYNIRKRIDSRIESDEYLDLSQYDIVEKVFDEIWEEMKDRGIVIDELIN